MATVVKPFYTVFCSEDMTAVEKEEGELEDGELDDEEEDTVYTAEKTDTQASQECKDDQGQPDYQPQDISYRREPSGDAKTNNLIQGRWTPKYLFENTFFHKNCHVLNSFNVI